jgi:hypothetical protein
LIVRIKSLFIFATTNFYDKQKKSIMNRSLFFSDKCILSKFFILIIVYVMTLQGTKAQVTLCSWDFSTLTGGTNYFGPSPYDANSTVADLTVTGLTRGSGIGRTGTGDVAAWGGTSFRVLNSSFGTAIFDNEYVFFTIKSENDKRLSLSSISAYNIRRSEFGPTKGLWEYSLDDGNNFTTIGSEITWGTDATATGNVQESILLSNIPELQSVPSTTTVLFRLLVWGATSITGKWYFNDISGGNDLMINGTVSDTTTWDGATWSNGVPDESLFAIINSEYNTALLGTFNARGLTVNANLTISSGHSIKIEEALENNGGITVENNANLIQGSASSYTGSSSFVVQRNSNSLFRLDYSLWSSPVESSYSLSDFSPYTLTGFPSRFYTYNSLSNLYTAVTDPTIDTFVTGKAYLIRMPNVNPNNTALTTPYYLGNEPLIFEGSFEGKPNNGDISVSTIANTYNGVGNPYPSTINADDFIANNATDGTLYFWRKKNGAAGSAYATYTTAGGVANSGGIAPNGTIQIGQGFIVKTLGTSVTFTNIMRTNNSDNQFLKIKKETTKSRIWLSLSNSKETINQSLIAYMNNATKKVDIGIDGKYFNDSKKALCSIIDGEEYVIQGLPSFDVADEVALSFKTDVSGQYTIALDKYDGLFENGQAIYLIDRLTSTETDLKSQSYTFDAKAGVDIARFAISYQKSLKVIDTVFNEENVKVFKNNGSIVVFSPTKNIKSLQVYDVKGVLLAQQTNLKSNTATVDNLNARNQMIVVQVQSFDDKVVTKKVMN